jgi:2-phospho-L-lactate guanylyltransferase
MSCWSLTAVRSYPSCKTRLSNCLSEQRRIDLVSDMLGHVISVLGRAAGVDQIAIVAPEHCVLPKAAVLLEDPGGGLNEALMSAALQARSKGADRLLIVHADLPLLSTEEVTVLIEASRVAGVAIAPDRRDRGTNALCLSWQSRLRFEFGPESFPRYMLQMAWRGISPAVVRSPGLAFDLDEPADLRCWSGYAEEGGRS